jgi:hypothetical protein
MLGIISFFRSPNSSDSAMMTMLSQLIKLDTADFGLAWSGLQRAPEKVPADSLSKGLRDYVYDGVSMWWLFRRPMLNSLAVLMLLYVLRLQMKHFREGVETRRAAPKPHVRNGEGIVQTTNPHLAGRRKPKWYENPQARKSCEGSSPSARTRICYRAGQDGTILAYCRTGAAGPVWSGVRALHTFVCSALYSTLMPGLVSTNFVKVLPPDKIRHASEVWKKLSS